VGSTPPNLSNQRLGFHYFPDTFHYRAKDLETWLPELNRLGAGWLTLQSPPERAIPEPFITGLLAGGVKPILHFQLSPRTSIQHGALRVLFRSYTRWGVERVSLFDRPNCRSSWHPSDWAQQDLVERFLDIFVAIAEIAIEEGLEPIFPPLEPGGDYWDLSFLQSALQALQRRNRSRLLDHLALSAYAWTGSKPLEWGSGGPERWPNARPYFTPDGCENQVGFRIFDWYLAVSRSELGRSLPLFLLRAGSVSTDQIDPQSGMPDWSAHARTNLAIRHLLGQDAGKGTQAAAIPTEVQACCFWLLAADPHGEYKDQAWFGSNGEKKPVVNEFYRAQALQDRVIPDPPLNEPAEPGQPDPGGHPPAPDLKPEPRPFSTGATQLEKTDHTISHYVLLPLYSWGVSEWDLEALQPLLQDSHPTIGFSLTEARLAKRVTVVGGEGSVSAESLNMLRANGCVVERISTDGTLVAS